MSSRVHLIVAFFLLSSLHGVAVAAAPRSFEAKIVGKGRAVILIPGLGAPPEVWDGTVAHYAKRYQVHRLALAGFAGAAPIEGEFLPVVRRELVDYVKTKKLQKPVLIGHSMGGWLALELASSYPDLFGPVVVVDAVPAFGALLSPQSTAAEMTARARATRESLAALTKEEFDQRTKASLATMITNPEELERVTAASLKSDPRTIMQAMEELFSGDLRGEVGKIESPLLLIAAGAYFPEPIRKLMLTRYREQMATAKTMELVNAEKAKHFVMLDDAPFLHQAIDAFLARHARAR